jgi:PAS domain S-box-containing protein
MAIDKNNSLLSTATELHSQAEERLRAQTAELQLPRNKEETLRLVHELEVHQIELEMQNEELIKTRNEVGVALDKYTDLYDFAPIGYFTLDDAGTILAANLVAAALLGIERSKLPGKRFGLFVQENAHLFFAEFLEKVFASQSKKSCEVTITGENSSEIFVQIEAVAYTSVKECRVAVIDITERKLAENEVERLNEQLAEHAANLEDANRELEAFNYTVAHDLRNPLNIICSYCQAIKEVCSDKLSMPCRRYVQETYDGAMRMNRLIEALLNFSQLTHAELKKETVDFSRMAKEVTGELEMTTGERRVEIRIADSINASGDANLLRVVLNNLFGNAWKFTGTRQEAVIEFGVMDIDGKQAYFVRDNGTGFDNADRDKLFIPFQRFSGAEECRGFGIGLATVERIIKRHGGRVWAEGEPGMGAVFYFTLQA